MIPLVKSYLPPKKVLMKSLEDILYSGYIAQGEAVDQFENEFSKFIGNKYCLSVNSGSSALHIALILCGVKDGDEVISTPITAEPTNTVIAQTGAKIVWGDIDMNTGNLCPKDVESKITKKTKAIMAVAYAGMPIDIKKFKEIEKKYKIPVIEDAAHALGASYKKQKLGNHFNFTIFSFQAIKHLTTIDGGMLFLSNKKQYEKAKLIRWFGLDKNKTRLKNNISLQGYKYHMNNINATVGSVQLKYFDKILGAYIDNGKYFDHALRNINGLELMKYYNYSEPSYWLYTMKVKNRSRFIKMMESNGVMASPLHKRNDIHSIFKQSKTNLPNVDNFNKEWVHIPCGWWVSKKDRKLITDLIKKGW